MKTKGSRSARKEDAPMPGKRMGTPVPTPDLDVTLAKRMRKRFSSRHGNSTMLSDTSSISSVSSALSQTQRSSFSSVTITTDQRLSQRTSNRKHSAAGTSRLATANIDKAFKSDESSSAVSSPTRFGRSKVTDTGENEDTSVETRSSRKTRGSRRGPKEGSGASGQTLPRGDRARKGTSPSKRKTRGATGTDEESDDSRQTLPRSGRARKESSPPKRKTRGATGTDEESDDLGQTLPRSGRARKESSPPKSVGSSAESGVEGMSEGAPGDSSGSTTKGASLNRRGRESSASRLVPPEDRRSSGSQNDTVSEGPVRAGPEPVTATSQSESVSSPAGKGRGKRGQARDTKADHWLTLGTRFGHSELSSSEDSRRRAIESSTCIDSDASLSDQQFVHSQVKIMSTPFTLESGPGDWIAAWKRKHSIEEGDEGIPKHVVNRAISKLNHSMGMAVRTKLSRSRQRAAFRGLLDERQRRGRTGGDALVHAHLAALEGRLVHQPDKVLVGFPEKWRNEESASQSGDLLKRYTKLRATVNTRVEKFVANREQLARNDRLLESLQAISNMEVPSSKELGAELERSRKLVSLVAEKLRKNRSRRTHSPRKASPHGPHGPSKAPPAAPQPRPLPNPHTLLTSLLFSSAGHS